MQLSNILGLFPGQGSQKVGMGFEFYKSTEIAQDIFNRASKALGFDLAKTCFEGPAEHLTQTAIAQPAILTVSYAAYKISQEKLNLTLGCACGHSLGEYSALCAAEAIKFEDAVALVNKRGAYMQEAVPAGLGQMAAILGKEVAEIEEALSKVTTGVAQIANINAPGQVVVAGDRNGIAAFLENLPGAKYKLLEVSAPFHCSLMKPAEIKLKADLSTMTIVPAKFPVVVNYSASALTNPEDIRKALELQVCGRVRWVECMQNAIAKFAPSQAIEFGEGNVLNGLLKRIAPELPRRSIAAPTDLAA